MEDPGFDTQPEGNVNMSPRKYKLVGLKLTSADTLPKQLIYVYQGVRF